MPRILVADNDPVELRRMVEYLEETLYDIIPATTPGDAKWMIDGGQVDLAVLDLRLTDDSREDISGLTVAKTTNVRIPKIIVSRFPNFEAAQKALTEDVDGLPAAISFLSKDELERELLPAVRRALKIWRTRFGKTQDEISEQLKRDYEDARRSAQFHAWSSLTLSIIFALPILYGVYLLHGETHTEGALTMVFIFIGSLGAEITNYFFARKTEFLYQRVDKFHTELLQARRFDQLMAACEEIEDEVAKREYRANVLRVALERWIGAYEAQNQASPPAKLAEKI